jgi:hypothetical protein
MTMRGPRRGPADTLPLMFHSRSLVVASSLFSFVLFGLACSSSDPASAPVTEEAGVDAAELPHDAAYADASADASPPDAPLEAAPLAPITGTLDVHTAGALVTTIKSGSFTPTSGSAQWRARPSGGGVLTVRLDEDAALSPRRSIELTLYDDAGTLDANEKFVAEAPNDLGLHKSRVETYQGMAGWRTGGDGTVEVVAFGATSVTLKLAGVGQFTQESAGPDTFVVEGTVTVPLFTFAPTATGAATLAISNLQNEPIGGDAPNVASPAQMLVSSTSSLDDLPYPFTSKLRAASFTSAAGGVTRNVRIAFPSGHLPRLGRNIDLSKFDRAQVTYFEGAALTEAQTEKVWQAAKGTLVIDALTASSMTLRLQTAGMQSESPSAKGNFDLDGTVTVQLPASP